MAETINDITNLKFYTAKGYEIPMQKSYVLTWELIPGKITSLYMQSKLTGYFIGDIDFTDSTNLKIKSLKSAAITGGSFYVAFSDTSGHDKNGIEIFEYSDDDQDIMDLDVYQTYINELFNIDTDNKVKISINIKNKSFTHTFNIFDIFALLNNSPIEDYIKVTTVYTGENLGGNKEFYQLIDIKKLDLLMTSDNNIPVIQQIFEARVPNIGIYFPFVRYSGDYYQDKISTDFIAADTILVLEEVEDGDSYTYVRPYINASSSYSLVFLPQTNSELKIVDPESKYNYSLQYIDEISFAMANPQSSDIADPFSFTIAFLASEEGAYQNLLGIYLKSKDNDTDKEYIFFMGMISIKSEVEGEDERFRTLLTNFGVPDPKYYSNIFAEQDYLEQGKDYELINRKSKEMMLSYDQIFSYVGTYKALIRAIKYLGYQDIIFKEWYSIRDTNDKYTDIAVLIFDSSTGDFLELKLADYGISIEDFNNYNKLNRLSMIYHLNEVSDDVEYIKTTFARYDNTTKSIINASSNLKYHTFISEVPLTKPIFTYRNIETLAKLFAVKQWLEQHIIGVGAYIADITGEGIYFGWQKTLGYSTEHYLNDFSQAHYYTPDLKNVTEFVDSSAIISCTLNELNNAIRFVDYDDTPIAAFNKYDISIQLHTTNNDYINTSILSISNSIESPVLGDEYEFDLVVKPNSGTLHEWMPANSSNEILLQDGEIKFLHDETKESFIDSSYLPIITLENANIHNAYGNWRTNIKWLIRETIDSETGNTKYKLQNYRVFLDNSNQKVVDKYIILEPDASANPYIKYSEKNKWDLPMFIIHGYKFANIDILENEKQYYNLNSSTCDYILEILKGDILFANKDDVGCQIAFDSDLIQNSENQTYINELLIQPIYTYHSDKKPFIKLNSSLIEQQANNSINCNNVIELIKNEIAYSINNTYQNIGNTILIELPGISIDNPALNDYNDFITNSSYITDVSNFINAVTYAKIQEILDSSLELIISNNYVCNSSIPVKVTRLGQYDLINRSFDKYNNMFASKYDNKVDVTAAPIPMDIYMSSATSQNDETFYRYNIDGSLLSSTQLTEIIDQCDNKAKYSKVYPIYNIDYNLNNDYVEFDNISYAIDTPKNNDYVVFNTMNERCIDISKNGDIVKLMMLDENPNKIFLYASTGEITKKISVFVYEPITKEFVYKVENYSVIDTSSVNNNVDINYNADSYIDIASTDDSNELLNYVNDKYKIYVLNTTEYPINASTILLDYDKKKSYITLGSDLVFNKEDVIKLRYNMASSIYINAENSSNGIIINETAYRIINVSTDSNNNYVYTINGLPNTTLLDSSIVSTTIMYDAQYPVKYTSKVISNAYEFNEVIGFNNYAIIRDHFKFNSTQLFLHDYIDDTYGIEVTDYDYINGEKYWLDFNQYINDTSIMEMYYYHQFPVSIELGHNMIFKSHDIRHTLLPNYKVDWCVKVDAIDELNNIPENKNNNNKEILFRSINNYLTIKPYMQGSHDIELICTDIYGNRLVNSGEGMLYVKSNIETDKYYDNFGYV